MARKRKTIQALIREYNDLHKGAYCEYELKPIKKKTREADNDGKA